MIQQIGNTIIQPIHKATCHCGAVELEIHLPRGISGFQRCNCSLCRRRGAIMVGVSLNELKITRGEDQLSLYQFHSKVAKHYFCKICGIYTHHQRRVDPNSYGVNLGCFDGVNPFALDSALINYSDGINHPCDQVAENEKN